MGSWLISLFCAVIGGLLIAISSPVHIESAKDEALFIRPIKALQHFTLGYSEFLADSYWIRVIQSFGTCDKPRGKAEVPAAKNLDQIVSNPKSISSCPDSWVYAMIDYITDLAPQFEFAYFAGAIDLLVGTDDVFGGGQILEKGIKQFPKNWKLAYTAAYFNLFDLKDIPRAADLLLLAHQNGGPDWLPVLASRLYSRTDRSVLAQSVLEEYIRTSPGGEGEQRARARLKELTGSDRLRSEK